MSFFLRSAIVSVLLLLSLQTIAFGNDAKPQVVNAELGAADHLYRAGKFAEAEAGYQAVLKNDSKLVPGNWSLLKSDGCGQCCANRRLMQHEHDTPSGTQAARPTDGCSRKDPSARKRRCLHNG
jgi:hypothetical protein